MKSRLSHRRGVRPRVRRAFLDWFRANRQRFTVAPHIGYRTDRSITKSCGFTQLNLTQTLPIDDVIPAEVPVIAGKHGNYTRQQMSADDSRGDAPPTVEPRRSATERT